MKLSVEPDEVLMKEIEVVIEPIEPTHKLIRQKSVDSPRHETELAKLLHEELASLPGD